MQQSKATSKFCGIFVFPKMAPLLSLKYILHIAEIHSSALENREEQGQDTSHANPA